MKELRDVLPTMMQDRMWSGMIMVVTGWRGWVNGTAVVAVITLIWGLIAFVLLGVPITVITVLVIVVPVAIGVAVLISFFRPPRGR